MGEPFPRFVSFLRLVGQTRSANYGGEITFLSANMGLRDRCWPVIGPPVQNRKKGNSIEFACDCGASFRNLFLRTGDLAGRIRQPFAHSSPILYFVLLLAVQSSSPFDTDPSFFKPKEPVPGSVQNHRFKRNDGDPPFPLLL